MPQLSLTELALLGCNDLFFMLTGLLNRPDAMHPWLYDRAREFEAEPDGHLDLWPRYHYKSTIITFAGNIQEIVVDPEVTICIFGNSLKISRPFLSQIAEELERNEFLKDIYPDVLWRTPKTQASNWSLERGITIKRKGTPKEATVEAHGLIDAMPTGRHFRLLIYDDTITEHSVSNPEQIKKATERYELSLSLGVGLATRVRMPGTRYSFADTYGQLIERDIVTPRVYSATEDGTLKGKPVFLTVPAWEDVKKKQRSVVASQFLQNPLAGSENMFQIEWLRPYELRPRRLNVYIMVDPSLGKSATSDRTAMAVVGVDAAMNRYLLDGYCHRMRLSQRWECLRDLWKKWNKAPGVDYCEVGYERYGQQTDNEYFEERMMMEKIVFSIRELNWVREGLQSKQARVERLEPYFRNSKFHMPCVVHHPDFGKATWSVDKKQSIILYKTYDGPTKAEALAQKQGEPYRVVEPIKRRDEDSNVYDLTRVFFEEFAFFPFSPRDDLIDATSRIEDMEPSSPLVLHQDAPLRAPPPDV